MTIRTSLPVASLLIACAAGGCNEMYQLRFENSPYVYKSYEMAPKTVKLIDLRSGEELFVMDIPAGKKLSVQFHPGAGSDDYAPDRMTWEVCDLDQNPGSHRNAMSVPDAGSRRLDWMIRDGVEFKSAPADEMSTQATNENPVFWGPDAGGPTRTASGN